MKGAFHSGLAKGAPEQAPAVQSHRHHDSVAFVHDITAASLPREYTTVDCIYSDLPWHAGYEKFQERAGVKGPSYQEFMDAVASIVLTYAVPIVLTGGRRMAKMLPTPTEARPATLNGDDCLLLCWGVHPTPGIDTAEALLADWAQRYRRVGDFCCGYGRAGATFAQAGGSYVMSDINARCIGYIADNAEAWHEVC